jgi:transcriptional regulator with XRE-family HTH domain
VRQANLFWPGPALKTVRLEAGEHEPSLATLTRLAQGLGIDFSIEITPTVFELKETA